MSLNIVLIGATSKIAQEVAKIYAQQKSNFYLLGRNAEQIERIANDLTVRGAATVKKVSFDLSELSQIKHFFENFKESVDVVLIAYGTLTDQQKAQQDPIYFTEQFQTNALSVMQWCEAWAQVLEKQHQGVLAVISSVAGDRGRQSNYAYGCAKAALSVYLQGLRNRLFKSGVHVLTIKPGFVDTPMTSAFPKSPLWASPEKVASQIVKAIHQKKDVIYTPKFWSLIMFVIRNIPEKIFKSLKL